MWPFNKELTGSEIIDEVVSSFSKQIAKLEEGIQKVKAEAINTQEELRIANEEWVRTETALTNKINNLDEAAYAGTKLKDNITNLLK